MLTSESRPPIFLIHPPGWVSVNPTLNSVISYLHDHGHQTHIISFTPVGDNLVEACNHALSVDCPIGASRILRRLLFLTMPFYVWLQFRRIRPAAVFVVDPPGALAASLVTLVTKVPCIYISLHMNSVRDLIDRGSYMKAFRAWLSTWALARIKVFITQDRFRQAAFTNTNRLRSTAKFFIVPNSHRGYAVRQNNRYYYDKFAIPPERPLVLIAGMVQAAWSHTKFLAECASRQGPAPNYTLIVQSREVLSESVAKELALLEHDNVKLALDPIPFADLRMAFGSVTVGVGIYSSQIHWNQGLVGGASGKMMSYLSAGTPVIMTDGAGVTDVINAFGCGEVLSELTCEAFNSLVRRITGDRDRYADNAVRCYNELYEFDHAFLGVYQFCFGPAG